MPSKTPYPTNPFASPIKASISSTSTPPVTDADIIHQPPDILATANLLLDQLKELETFCSTVEERVQRKRRTLKELEDRVAASAVNAETPPSSPNFSANTPVPRRLRFMSPRLRGLFDLRGPAKANPFALQSSLDYSPERQGATNLQDPVREEAEQTAGEEWEDDDEEAPLCPFDDKYALEGNPSPWNMEKALPAVPIEQGEVQTTKIPKLHLKRRISTSKYFTGRSGAMTRVPSNRRRPSMRRGGSKPLETAASPKNLTKGTMRRGSGQRGILENVNGKTKANVRAQHANDDENGRESSRQKEKRKRIWSIYSIYSELGLSGPHHAVSG